MSQFFVVVDVVSNVGFEQVNAGWDRSLTRSWTRAAGRSLQ